MSGVIAIQMSTFIAFDRTHTLYVVFRSQGFYDVPRVLIADAGSFQALPVILDCDTQPRCHAGNDPMPDNEFRRNYLKLHYWES